MREADGIGELLFRQRNRDGGADVVFEVCRQEIWAHSIVITKRSKYFESLFSGEFREAKDLRAHVQDCTVKDFEAFLYLLYTCKFDIQRPFGTTALATLGPRIAMKRITNVSLDSVVDFVQQHPAYSIVYTDGTVEGGALIRARPSLSNRLSFHLLQAFPDATTKNVSDKEFAHARSVLASVLAVMKLLDRYSVDGFVARVCDELEGLIAWGRSIWAILTACLGLVEGSEFRKALWELCRTYVFRNDEQAVCQFRVGYGTIPIHSDESSVRLRASLQILRWQLDWVNANETLLGDKGLAFRKVISGGLQEVVDRWAALPEVQIPDRKRARTGE